MRILLVGALNILATSAAAAQATLPSGEALTWTLSGKYARIEGYYPERAVRARINGFAILRCSATQDGRVASCVTSAFEPQNYGLDQAAQLASKSIVLDPSPRWTNGSPVTVGFNFQTRGSATGIAVTIRPDPGSATP